MASLKVAPALLAVVIVFQTVTSTPISQLLSPLLSPVFEDVCKEVLCGKGTCKPSNTSTFFYACECDPGWKQVVSDEDNLKFLPCIVPNCTLNYSCKKAPSATQEKASNANYSIFDPCHWTDCGGGSCNKTSSFSYACVCSEGYENLLNTSAFPCVRQCAIGVDCAFLGLSSSNKSSSTNTSATAGENLGSSIHRGSSPLLTSFIIVMAMVLWN